MNKILKRRIKNNFKNNTSIVVIAFAVLFVVLLSTGFAIFNTTLSVDGKTTIVISEEHVCTSDITSSLTRGSSWGDGAGATVYLFTISVTNNSSIDIVDWVMEIKGPSDMKVQANGDVVSDNGISTITPYSWNSKIVAGGNFELTISITTVEEDFMPTYLLFNGCTVYGDSGISTYELINDDSTNTIDMPSEYMMTVGERVVLNTNIEPKDGEELVYVSSDTNVASVSQSGEVVALNEGTTTITVSYGDVSYSTIVTVVNEEETSISPDGINISVNNTSYWGDANYGYTGLYTIDISNTGLADFSNCSFILNLPTGTNYTIWTTNTSETNGKFVYNGTINNGNTVSIYIQAVLPSGYNITDYMNPTVSNIKVG
jgi:uncharacterized repeat protein (TIGR01451 family)